VRKILFLLVSGLLLIFVAPAGVKAVSPLEGKVIMVDPGHGGYDPGAVRAGILEKNINLQIAIKLKGLLEGKGARVLLTRDGDYNLAVAGLHKKEAHRYDLGKRLDIAKQSGACLLISIHTNCTFSRSQQGAEVFYYPPSENGKIVADSIQSELRSIPGMSKRISKASNCFILRNASMPAVLIEVGYLSSPGERKNLQVSEYQELISQKISSGILNYLVSKNKSGAAVPPVMGTYENPWLESGFLRYNRI